MESTQGSQSTCAGKSWAMVGSAGTIMISTNITIMAMLARTSKIATLRFPFSLGVFTIISDADIYFSIYGFLSSNGEVWSVYIQEWRFTSISCLYYC